MFFFFFLVEILKTIFFEFDTGRTELLNYICFFYLSICSLKSKIR